MHYSGDERGFVYYVQGMFNYGNKLAGASGSVTSIEDKLMCLGTRDSVCLRKPFNLVICNPFRRKLLDLNIILYVLVYPAAKRIS